MNKANIGIIVINSLYSMIIIQITVNRLLRVTCLSGHISGVFLLKDDFAENNCLMRNPGAHIMQ